MQTANSIQLEKLEVWQLSRVFVGSIYKITMQFPREEMFGLISQLRRAAISLVLNIAEGADRRSDTDFRRFLRMAQTSLEEVVSGLYIALDQNFIHQTEFETLYTEAHIIACKINAFINRLSGR